MRIFRPHLVALAALVLPAAAEAAGEIVISAGEHGDHSRVVVAASAGPVLVTRSDRTIGLHFSPLEADFNLGDINERRKARRVMKAHAIATPAGSVVRLDLACDCRVEQQRLGDGRLVIDIYDAALAKKPETQTAAPAKKPAASGKITEADALSVEEARNRMIELLQKAADDGLVTVKDGAPELTKPTPLVPVGAAETNAPTSPANSRAGNARTAPAPAMYSCLPDAAFAFDGSALDSDPLGAITALQAGLADAAPGQEHKAVEALAEGYLAIAFGDEALAALEEYGEANSLRADMARIVAERSLSPASIILAASDCRGAHALWQAAAAEPARAAVAAKRSGDAVAALPKRLRAALATRIAKKMIEAEDWAETRRFYAVASSAVSAATPDLQFIAAKLLEQDGAESEADRLMKEVASTNSEASKDALLALAERYTESGETPPDGFAEDIGALAKTEQGAARGGEAALREAMLWANEGNIEAGVMLLKNAARVDPDAAPLASAKARSLLLQAFASKDEARMISALDSYLQNKDFVDLGASGDDVPAAATRAAIALGAPNAALGLLASQDRDAAHAMLRAKALLAANDPERALQAAAPYAEDPAFAALIVDANLALERNYAALAAASAFADPQQKAAAMANAAWRAGDWASAARAYQKIDPAKMSVEEAKRYALAAYMAGEKSMPQAAEAVLNQQSSPDLAGLKSLFDVAADGTILDRSKAAIAGADAEIDMIEEMLSDG